MMARRLISVILTAILVLPSLYVPTFSMGAGTHSTTSTSPDPFGWGTDKVSYSSTCMIGCSGSWPHAYTITHYEQANGAFSGTGVGLNDSATEVINGTVTPSGNLTLHSVYTGGGYSYDVTATRAGDRTFSGTAISSQNQPSTVTLSPPKGSSRSPAPSVTRGMYGESCPPAETDVSGNLTSATPSCAPISTTFHIQELHGDSGIELDIMGEAHGRPCPGECDVKLSDGGGRVIVAGTGGQHKLYPTLCIAPDHSKWIYWGGGVGCPLPPHNLAQSSSRGMYGESCPPAETDVSGNLTSATPSCAPISTTFHIQELYGDSGIELDIMGEAHGRPCPGECDVKLSDGGGRVIVAGTGGQHKLYPTLCIAPDHSKWIYWGGRCPTDSQSTPLTPGPGDERGIKIQAAVIRAHPASQWTGTVATFSGVSHEATAATYNATVIWNDRQLDVDTQARRTSAAHTSMRTTSVIGNVVRSGLMSPASILSADGDTRTPATIKPLGHGLYAIVTSHRFSHLGHEHVLVSIQTGGGTRGATPDFAYTETMAYVDSVPDATMIAAGRAQALRFDRDREGHPRYYATQALLAHSTNPWFVVGFFNNLDYHRTAYGEDGLTLLLKERDTLAYFMGPQKYKTDQVDRHMIQAIVSALASGHASSAFTFTVLIRLVQGTSGQGPPGDAGTFFYYELGSAIAANVAAANNLVNSHYNLEIFLSGVPLGNNDYVMNNIAATIVTDHIGVYATTNWAEATDADRQKSKYWQLLLVATQVPDGTMVAPTLAKLELAMGVWVGIHMPQHLVISTCDKSRCSHEPHSGEMWAIRTGFLARNLAEASVTHINDSNTARTLRANVIASIAFWALPFTVSLAADAIATYTAIEVSSALVNIVAGGVGLGSAVAVPFLPLGPSASDVSAVLRATYKEQREAAAKLIARLLLLRHALLDCTAYPSHPCTPAPTLSLHGQPHGQVDSIVCNGNDIVDRVAAEGDYIDCGMSPKATFILPKAAFILKDQFGRYSYTDARSHIFSYMLIWLPN